MIHPYKHTVPIVNGDRHTPNIIASGIYIMIDGLKLVITAAHVFENNFAKIGFTYPRNDIGMWDTFCDLRDWPDRPELEVGVIVMTTNWTPGQKEEYPRGLDLGIIEPTPRLIEKLDEYYEPYDFRNNPPPPKVDNQMMMCGWPCRHNEYNPHTKKANFKGWLHLPVNALPRTEFEKVGARADCHICFGLDKKKGYLRAADRQRIVLPKDLKGMSGGGLWHTVGGAPDGSGTEVQSLAGILISEHTSLKQATAVRIDHVWGFLVNAFRTDNPGDNFFTGNF